MPGENPRSLSQHNLSVGITCRQVILHAPDFACLSKRPNVLRIPGSVSDLICSAQERSGAKALAKEMEVDFGSEAHTAPAPGSTAPTSGSAGAEQERCGATRPPSCGQATSRGWRRAGGTAETADETTDGRRETAARLQRAMRRGTRTRLGTGLGTESVLLMALLSTLLGTNSAPTPLNSASTPVPSPFPSHLSPLLPLAHVLSRITPIRFAEKTLFTDPPHVGRKPHPDA